MTAHLQGGLLLEPYKTHRRVGAVFRRECPGIQTYFWFENKFVDQTLFIYSLKEE
jgi:hypothetical protein